ncbi:MAG: protein jag [Oscillospiraceae bacterium]|jgi:spoIIIJ-associated protein|nr:protein jag [Oscillospiraceae bacterium]
MTKEAIELGKTIELAIKAACDKLGVHEDDDGVEIEVLERPKKGILGINSAPAKVKVTFQIDKADHAREFLFSVVDAMGLEGVAINVKKEENSALLTLNGEDLGCIIGHHGEILDALQYIVGLVINQEDGEYFRITLDCGNFRKKREKSLEGLAEKIARQVLKYGKPVSLEPMNPYERRIVHSAIQKIDNVTSSSTGEEPNRCVVISSTLPPRRRFNNDERFSRPRGPYNNPGRSQTSNNNSGYKKGPSQGARRDSDRDKSRYPSQDKGYRDYNRDYKDSRDYNRKDPREKAEAISDKDINSGLYKKIKLDD